MLAHRPTIRVTPRVEIRHRTCYRATDNSVNSVMAAFSRRQLIAGLTAIGLAPPARSALASSDRGALDPQLLRRALRAFEAHQDSLKFRDYIGIADFSAPSRSPRFHLVDMMSGQSRCLLVAHGRGSDPGHSGWVERFSNLPGSAASSQGAYLTGDIYSGKHGRSRRLVGLDPDNNNAEARAIVIHAAWYVSPDMVRQHGKLGRSEGCFAFSDADLKMVLDRLGPGRLIYADKISKGGKWPT